MTNISLLLITKNESANINTWKTWLPKLKLVNELIVVDSQSTDDTVKKIQKLANKKLVVKTLDAENPHNFSSLRSQAIDKCKNDWILWLDADETPSPKLIKFLNHFNSTNYNYSFPRRDTFLGEKLHHGETVNQSFLRFFNKNFGKFQGAVHEIWQTTKPVVTTNYIIYHHPHPNFYSFIQKINLYSSLRAHELKKQGIRTNLFLIMLYPIAKFVQDYFFYQGFRDGTKGIIFAIGMSFHSFLVRAKLWHLSQTSSH